MVKYSLMLNIERKNPLPNDEVDTLLELLQSTLWNEAEMNISSSDLKMI